jgi:hypothetical protein
MSNEVMNQHIAFGSPLGDSEGLYEIADWAGEMLSSARRLIEQADPPSNPEKAKQWMKDRRTWLKGDAF